MQLSDKLQRILAKEHILTVPELMAQLKKRRQDYNKTSIYRALEKMQQDGVVCRMSFGTNDVFYELRSHHHDHTMCRNCGQLSAVRCQTPDKDRIGGFKVEHHHTTFFGLCPSCKEV